MPERVTPTGPLFAPGRMHGYDYATEHPFGSHRDLRAVVQTAHDLAFGTLLKLIGRQEQTRLDERMIKGRVLLATGHKTEPQRAGVARRKLPGYVLH